MHTQVYLDMSSKKGEYFNTILIAILAPLRSPTKKIIYTQVVPDLSKERGPAVHFLVTHLASSPGSNQESLKIAHMLFLARAIGRVHSAKIYLHLFISPMSLARKIEIQLRKFGNHFRMCLFQ